MKDINGSVINFDAGGEEIEIDLDGAEFNGDRRSPPNSSHGAYLICEYRNGDRFSFYAPRLLHRKPDASQLSAEVNRERAGTTYASQLSQVRRKTRFT